MERNKLSIAQKNWKKFYSNSKSIALNVLYVPYNNEEIRHAYISKHNLTCKSQVILLMITDAGKWHYLAVKNLCALFKGTTSENNGGFYYLNCLHLHRTKDKLNKYENKYKTYDYCYYCYIEMSEKDKSLLKYSHKEKYMKVPFIIYADTKSLLEKIYTFHSNPEK